MTGKIIDGSAAKKAEEGDNYIIRKIIPMNPEKGSRVFITFAGGEREISAGDNSIDDILLEDSSNSDLDQEASIMAGISVQNPYAERPNADYK